MLRPAPAASAIRPHTVVSRVVTGSVPISTPSPRARTGNQDRVRTVTRGPARALSRAAWASSCDSRDSATPERVWASEEPERSEISQHAASWAHTERAVAPSTRSPTGAGRRAN